MRKFAIVFSLLFFLVACTKTQNEQQYSIPPQNTSCPTGHFEQIDGRQHCCRGYRADSENWLGYVGTQCCPEGTSVNGFGQCVACGFGQYYNMAFADIQHKSAGTEACGLSCTSNDDCPNDRFCYMDAHATQADTTVNPVVGTCVSAADVGGIFATQISISSQQPTYWIGPKNMMDWWSARNFCMRYAHTDLPTRQQICGHKVEPWNACSSPLRKELEKELGAKQDASQFWLEEDGLGKAYYADPLAWGYLVKIPPEITARARSNGVVCGPVSKQIFSSFAIK